MARRIGKMETEMIKKKLTLFDRFENQYVSILTKLVMERTVQSGEIIETFKTPVSVSGFLIDSDDSYYYLGHTPGLISQALPHEELVHIEITREEAGLMEELLENGEIPPEDQFN
jgi:hypothetical protein